MQRVKAWHRYARAVGYSHGWPNFEEADYGPGVGVVYGGYLIPRSAEPNWGAHTLVEFGDLGLNCFETHCTFELLWRAANRWAGWQGAFTGVPTFTSDFFRTTLLAWPSRDYFEWQDVPRRELEGQPEFGDPGACIRGINRWANQRGYPAAFPNFEQADHGDGRGVVYGTILFKPSAPLEWRDVKVSELRRHQSG